MNSLTCTNESVSQQINWWWLFYPSMNCISWILLLLLLLLIRIRWWNATFQIICCWVQVVSTANKRREEKERLNNIFHHDSIHLSARGFVVLFTRVMHFCLKEGEEDSCRAILLFPCCCCWCGGGIALPHVQLELTGFENYAVPLEGSTAMLLQTLKGFCNSRPQIPICQNGRSPCDMENIT